MQKTGIVVSMILWVLLAFNVAGGYTVESKNITEAFQSIEFREIKGEIQGNAKCKEKPADVNDFLKQLAIDLGSNTEYRIETVNTDNGTATSLIKNSDTAQLCIKYVELSDTEQYVSISMYLQDNIESALSYKNLIEEIYKNNGMKATVTLCFTGTISGPLNYGEKNAYSDMLLKQLDAEVVVENRDSSLFTIYAYTKSVDEYIVTSGKKININIILEYDEITDMTLIYLATPLNNLDY